VVTVPLAVWGWSHPSCIEDQASGRAGLSPYMLTRFHPPEAMRLHSPMPSLDQSRS